MSLAESNLNFWSIDKKFSWCCQSKLWLKVQIACYQSKLHTSPTSKLSIGSKIYSSHILLNYVINLCSWYIDWELIHCRSGRLHLPPVCSKGRWLNLMVHSKGGLLHLLVHTKSVLLHLLVLGNSVMLPGGCARQLPTHLGGCAWKLPLWGD